MWFHSLLMSERKGMLVLKCISSVSVMLVAVLGQLCHAQDCWKYTGNTSSCSSLFPELNQTEHIVNCTGEACDEEAYCINYEELFDLHAVAFGTDWTTPFPGTEPATTADSNDHPEASYTEHVCVTEVPCGANCDWFELAEDFLCVPDISEAQDGYIPVRILQQPPCPEA